MHKRRAGGRGKGKRGEGGKTPNFWEMGRRKKKTFKLHMGGKGVRGEREKADILLSI